MKVVSSRNGKEYRALFLGKGNTFSNQLVLWKFLGKSPDCLALWFKYATQFLGCAIFLWPRYVKTGHVLLLF